MQIDTRLVGSFVGMLGVAVIGVLYFASGLLAPLWAVIGLMIVWAAHVGLGCLWFSRHPWRVLALPVSLLVIWVLVITVGEQILGWTA